MKMGKKQMDGATNGARKGTNGYKRVQIWARSTDLFSFKHISTFTFVVFLSTLLTSCVAVLARTL